MGATAKHLRVARLPAVDELRSLGLGAGLDAFGVTEATAWPDALARLRARQAEGYDAGMGFTYRNPARATDPRRALPDAAALVVGAVAYRRRPPSLPRLRPGRSLASRPTPGSTTKSGSGRRSRRSRRGSRTPVGGLGC